jgi:hypothetical protein
VGEPAHIGIGKGFGAAGLCADFDFHAVNSCENKK